MNYAVQGPNLHINLSSSSSFFFFRKTLENVDLMDLGQDWRL